VKLPRDISGIELAKALTNTIPAHQPLKVGTLSAILGEVGARLQLDREALLERIGF